MPPHSAVSRGIQIWQKFCGDGQNPLAAEITPKEAAARMNDRNMIAWLVLHHSGFDDTI